MAILALPGTVVGAAMRIMPIEGLAKLAVALLPIARTVDPGEAWASIDGSLLVLIYSMLAIGAGFQQAGSVNPLIGLAQQLGIDPRPQIASVVFASSASFATVIGYQTNTLVYAVADYRSADFSQ